MWNCCTKSHSINILMVALHVSSSVNSKSINVKLYKLNLSAEGICSSANFTVASLLAVAWYDKHSKATFCFAINLQAFSYICVLCIPNPQNMAKASNKDTSQSVKGWLFALLINWATPIIVFFPFRIGMQSIVLASIASGHILKSFNHVLAFPILSIWPVLAA